MTIFLDLVFTHSGKKAISCGVLENMFPEKYAEMNIKIGRQRFADLNLHNIWFSSSAFRSALPNAHMSFKGWNEIRDC